MGIGGAGKGGGGTPQPGQGKGSGGNAMQQPPGGSRQPPYGAMDQRLIDQRMQQQGIAGLGNRSPLANQQYAMQQAQKMQAQMQAQQAQAKQLADQKASFLSGTGNNNLMPDGTPRPANTLQSMLGRPRTSTSYGAKGGGGNGKGGGGNAIQQGKGGGGNPQQQMAQDYRSQMGAQQGNNALRQLLGFNNGGIVGLAAGGRLGAVTGGGVTYGPASPAPPAVAVAPTVAAPVAAAPVATAPAWTPQPVTGNGGMFSGIASVPIAQPAAWSGPTTPQKLWEPPKKVEAAPGLKSIDFNRAILFGGLSPAQMGQMSDRQYIDYRLFHGGGRGSSLSGGGGGRSHGDRGGYSR